jgi:hypothetical protein
MENLSYFGSLVFHQPRLGLRFPAPVAERLHSTGRERMGSATLQPHQDPVLLLPWVCVRGDGFPNPSPFAEVTQAQRQKGGAGWCVCKGP